MGGFFSSENKEVPAYDTPRKHSTLQTSYTDQSRSSFGGNFQNATPSRPSRPSPLHEVPQPFSWNLPEPLIETRQPWQLIENNYFDSNYFPSISVVQSNMGEDLTYTIDLLSPEDPEFRAVRRRIVNRHIIVDSIGVINAPFLEKSYMLKKEQKRPLEELELFHGTEWENVDLICNNNFNWRYHGTHVGQRFGRGVSFSCNAMYAANYSKDDGEKVMFIAKVMVSERCEGRKGMILPDDGCDASTKHGDDIVLVKYEDNEFYPIYQICFHFSPDYVPKKTRR